METFSIPVSIYSLSRILVPSTQLDRHSPAPSPQNHHNTICLVSVGIQAHDPESLLTQSFSINTLSLNM